MDAKEIAKNVQKIEDTISVAVMALEKANASDSQPVITVLQSCWKYLAEITNNIDLGESK